MYNWYTIFYYIVYFNLYYGLFVCIYLHINFLARKHMSPMSDPVHAFLGRAPASAHAAREAFTTVTDADGDKRRRLRNLNRYVFGVVDDVFDETTLAALRTAYTSAERRVAELGKRTLKDGSYVSRNGRFDVALGAPRQTITDFVMDAMKFEAPTRLRTGVRALVVPAATDAQPWHQDLVTRDADPRYVTLVVALEDSDGNGATEFKTPAPSDDGILRGAAPFNPLTYEGVYHANLRANQGILFDGRIMHRGGAATRRRTPFVYLVYTEPELEENV